MTAAGWPLTETAIDLRAEYESSGVKDVLEELDRDLAARLDGDLDDDFSRSVEIDLTRWRNRPAPQRALEAAVSPLRRWM